MGDTVVGICYRPPDQEEQVDETFYTRLEVASYLQALVLMGVFNYPSICWRKNTAGDNQSRRFLEDIDHIFLTEVTEEQEEVICWTSNIQVKKNSFGMCG